MHMSKNIKLTKFSSGAGWACKIPADALSQVLGKLNNERNSKSFKK